MDRGAHFFRCDFQVHSPRDTNWIGSRPSCDGERKAYAQRFVAACRARGLDAVGVTDHHDFAFFECIKEAAQEERDGYDTKADRQLIVFPGMELTLGVPCQAILLLDADFPVESLPNIYAVLSIDANHPDRESHAPVKCLEHFRDLTELHRRLDENSWLRGHYIVLPNLSENGSATLLRSRFKAHYKDMPCVGGYLDGAFSQLGAGNLRIINGEDMEYGNKAVGVFPTSDNRHDDFSKLGLHTAWVKWAEPTAEALRQACLARHTRILHHAPHLPAIIIKSLEVTNSKFLGPVVLELNPQYNCVIGGRGTGKSTLLEYLRWGLCDQPPVGSGDDDETPDFQAKRASLIKKTLLPFEATVTVGFSVRGVPHLVRRDSATTALSLKIASGEFRECTEQEIRDLLPVRAYSQKQLSAVGVRTEELVRFIEAPIRRELGDLLSADEDLKSQVRAQYQCLQRKRAIEKDLARDNLEAESIQQQIDSLRDSLKGLSEGNKEVLARHDRVLAEEQIIATWIRELERLDIAVRHVATELTMIPSVLPLGTRIHNEDIVAAISGKIDAIVSSVRRGIDDIAATLSPGSTGMSELSDLRRQWAASRDAHNVEYEAVKRASSSHENQLKQIAETEGRQTAVKSSIAGNQEKLHSLGASEDGYQQAKSEWVQVFKSRAEILQEKCAELTTLSDGRRCFGSDGHTECLIRALELSNGRSVSWSSGRK